MTLRQDYARPRHCAIAHGSAGRSRRPPSRLLNDGRGAPLQPTRAAPASITGGLPAVCTAELLTAGLLPQVTALGQLLWASCG
jgi:hypothetical protein